MKTDEFQDFADAGPSSDSPQHFTPLEAPQYCSGDSFAVLKVSTFRPNLDDRASEGGKPPASVHGGCAVTRSPPPPAPTRMRFAARNLPPPHLHHLEAPGVQSQCFLLPRPHCEWSSVPGGHEARKAQPAWRPHRPESP